MKYMIYDYGTCEWLSNSEGEFHFASQEDAEAEIQKHINFWHNNLNNMDRTHFTIYLEIA